ncbi:hypothetical protein [uncultured Eubacterium sp.]|uniref:hypothetical protein n=1 Tax=Eubacterium sp. TaxID=142586 RepID=UPI0026738A2E|nr:hypothetical protein [uncultured Eubacterium sp.]
MIKLLIIITASIILILINRMFMKKDKYFFPIIPLIISCVIIIISIVQIIQKENEYSGAEEQPIAIEESVFEDESFITAENEFNNSIKVSTHKSLFAIDLLGDFILLNIPTILCTLNVVNKKKS